MNREEAIEVLKAAGKDVSRLQKKVITNKQGKKQTVYVSNEKDEPKKDKSPKKDGEPNEGEDHVASGTLNRGLKVTNEKGEEFTLKRDVPMKFKRKTDDGKVIFENKGKEYTVDAKQIKDLEHHDGEGSETGEEEENPVQSKKPEVRADNIVSKLKAKLSKFTDEQQQFFHDQEFMVKSDFRSNVADAIKKKAKGIVKALKHEVHEIKLAGSAIKKVLPPPPYGKLDDKEKKAVKQIGTHLALTVGTMIATGGVGHIAHLAAAGTGKLGAAIGLHFLEHAGIMSVGKALAFAKGEDDGDDTKVKSKLTDEEAITKLIEQMAEYIENADLSDTEWVSLIENQDDTIAQMEKIAGKKYDLSGEKSEKKEDDEEDSSKDEKTEEVKKGDEEEETEGEDDFAYKKYMGKSLGKKRSEMPQFDEDTLVDVLVHFSDHAKISKIKKPLSSLKPTQDEINEDKILGMIKNKTDYKDTKYLISLDNYLLDSHHRWALGLEDNPDEEVNCYRISLPIKNLLKRANQLKIAKKVDIDDKAVKKS